MRSDVDSTPVVQQQPTSTSQSAPQVVAPVIIREQQPSNASQTAPQVTANGMSVVKNRTQGCPSGLRYLFNIDKLLIKQNMNIVGAGLDYEVNNKYTIYNKVGQKVFQAVEENNFCTHMFWGSMRPFEMMIFDNLKNEVIHLSRPLACDNCLFPCCLQTIEVFSPPGHFVGIVEQDWSIFKPVFTIRNAAHEEVLNIKGPICRYSVGGSDVNFKVLSKDKTTVVGYISKKWAVRLRETFIDGEYFDITFPMDLDVHLKAVMIGACFLIDFIFYENRGS